MDFVTFEIAKKLKEKGFREPCFGWYRPREVCVYDYQTFIDLNQSDCRGDLYDDLLISHNDDKHIDAPTISQVLKWLREKYSIHISTKPYSCEDGLVWLYEIRKFNKNIVFIMANKTGFTKEEQASLAGIEYVIDNLI